eukprot:Cvel_24397.t1-p1 / transcript=Cvel_24397.t1 / gene=Cvel_24397 / organism=Chromera_velia_CCMP2878 / gene_product=hypothetical protein / transcript_product=hypothetical protein / location=Cvel_scaffold2632:397-2150(-) / protein_length=507 / sequence_SO=supercontig / SO=protein_coding / is_pseudo=false
MMPTRARRAKTKATARVEEDKEETEKQKTEVQKKATRKKDPILKLKESNSAEAKEKGKIMEQSSSSKENEVEKENLQQQTDGHKDKDGPGTPGFGEFAQKEPTTPRPVKVPPESTACLTPTPVVTPMKEKENITTPVRTLIGVDNEAESPLQPPRTLLKIGRKKMATPRRVFLEEGDILEPSTPTPVRRGGRGILLETADEENEFLNAQPGVNGTPWSAAVVHALGADGLMAEEKEGLTVRQPTKGNVEATGKPVDPSVDSLTEGLQNLNIQPSDAPASPPPRPPPTAFQTPHLKRTPRARGGRRQGDDGLVAVGVRTSAQERPSLVFSKGKHTKSRNSRESTDPFRLSPLTQRREERHFFTPRGGNGGGAPASLLGGGRRGPLPSPVRGLSPLFEEKNRDKEGGGLPLYPSYGDGDGGERDGSGLPFPMTPVGRTPGGLPPTSGFPGTPFTRGVGGGRMGGQGRDPVEVQDNRKFAKEKETLAAKFFEEFNKEVFEMKLPQEMQII